MKVYGKLEFDIPTKLATSFNEAVAKLAVKGADGSSMEGVTLKDMKAYVLNKKLLNIANDATNIAADADLQIVYNEPVVKGTGNITINGIDNGGSTAGNGAVLLIAGLTSTAGNINITGVTTTGIAVGNNNTTWGTAPIVANAGTINITGTSTTTGVNQTGTGTSEITVTGEIFLLPENTVLVYKIGRAHV